MREKLINAILDLASDELEDINELIQLAKESEDALIDRIISIAKYYQDNY